MTDANNEGSAGRVFISYVRENSDMVDRLAHELRSAGVGVWLDRTMLLPGTRWRAAIRNAISDGTFFLACFSAESVARERTEMNEELTVAIEELRRRRIDSRWFIPVLFSPCAPPAYDIGAGETLRDIHFVRLHEDWEAGVRAILQVVGAPRGAHEGSTKTPPAPDNATGAAPAEMTIAANAIHADENISFTNDQRSGGSVDARGMVIDVKNEITAKGSIDFLNRHS